MNGMNLERSPEFQRLTRDKAWTVADVRRIMPDVPCLAPVGKAGVYVACTGVIRGRKNDFATVIVPHDDGSLDSSCEAFDFAWSTIAASLNNNRALRF